MWPHPDIDNEGGSMKYDNMLDHVVTDEHGYRKNIL